MKEASKDYIMNLVFYSGASLLVIAGMLSGFHHYMVLPGDQEADELKNDTVNILADKENCRLRSIYELSAELGVNKWKTTYIVQQLQLKGFVGIDSDGHIYLNQVKCLQEKSDYGL